MSRASNDQKRPKYEGGSAGMKALLLIIKLHVIWIV